MGQYSKTAPTPGAAITASYLDGELGKIKAAYDDMDNTNMAGSDFIPNAALDTPESVMTLHLRQETLGAGVLIATIQDNVALWKKSGVEIIIERVSAVAATIAGAPAPTVDVYKNGVSILAAPISIAAANTAYSAAATTASTADGDVYTLHCTTQAGAGAMTMISVTIFFKAQLTD